MQDSIGSILIYVTCDQSVSVLNKQTGRVLHNTKISPPRPSPSHLYPYPGSKLLLKRRKPTQHTNAVAVYHEEGIKVELPSPPGTVLRKITKG